MLSNLQVCFNAVMPLFLIMGLGYGVKCLGGIRVEDVPGLNKMAFRFFMPVMLFWNLYTSSIDQALQPKLLLFAVGATLVMYGLSLAIVLPTEKDYEKQGVKIQGMYRSNLAIIGLPLATVLVPGADMGPVAMLAAIIVPLFNVLAVITLTAFRGERLPAGRLIKMVATNPLILGSAVGLVFLGTGWRLPTALESAVHQVATMTSPFMLFLLGAFFRFSGLRRYRRDLIEVCVVRLFLMPALLLTTAFLIGIRGVGFAGLISVFASATAIASFTMTQQMGGDAELAGDIVVSTSALCIVTMFAWSVLFKALGAQLNRMKVRPGKHDAIEGMEQLDKVIAIDQSPIGRTPRSNPATYTNLFNLIRDLFASTPDAKARGYGPGRFSFNTKGGRCEACGGDGMLKIEMHFLSDVYVPCEICRGKRYNRETLEVRYKGKNIADVLDMTVDEAWEFFSAVPAICDKLTTLRDVGLGYVKLGQPSTTLSGGEAQRVKLATELSRRATGRTVYILDEPTTGLHADDVRKLLEVLQRLTDGGNTVLVIEHNLDVIKCADYIIDLGPEGGVGGGTVVACGTPEEIAACPASYTGQYLKKYLK